MMKLYNLNFENDEDEYYNLDKFKYTDHKMANMTKKSLHI